MAQTPKTAEKCYLVGTYVEQLELDSIRESLSRMGITRVNVTEAKEYPPFSRHGIASLKEPRPKLKLEVMVEEGKQDSVATIFSDSARIRGVESSVWYHEVSKYKP